MKITTLGLAAIATLLALPAQAETFGTFCGNRKIIQERLADKYSEAPVIRALSGAGNLVEMLASPSGSWTMIVTRPGGQTCIVSTGDMWQPLGPAAASQPQA